MKLYIDPGVSSMLFTIVIGIFGALVYVFRNILLKAKFAINGGRKARDHLKDDRESFVFYTDSKRYWNIFKPLCDEMEQRGQDVLYLTASEDDPLLSEKYQHIRCEYAGKDNKAYARMNFIRSMIVLSSTPSLDVYQWKRSRDVSWYVHISHGIYDFGTYKMFGLDYYDSVLLCGPFQEATIRETERVRHLPAKETVVVGAPQLDYMRDLVSRSTMAQKSGVTVLLAPSWGCNSIFNRFGETIIQALINTGYHLIIRPHPQSMISEKDLMDKMQSQFPVSENLEWNFDNDNFDVLNRSDILISDFSGVIFDFAMVFDKPIIYTEASFDTRPYDAGWLENEMWFLTILDKLGKKLTSDNVDSIKSLIDDCLTNDQFKSGRDEVRQEVWSYIGESVEKVADYLVNKKEELDLIESNRKK